MSGALATPVNQSSRPSASTTALPCRQETLRIATGSWKSVRIAAVSRVRMPSNSFVTTWWMAAESAA